VTIDYATMPAGAEIDALVATRVMGWPTIGMNTPFREAGNAHGVVVREDDGWLKPMRFARVGDACPLDDSWRPSTDIAAAWQVVEAVIHRGRYVHDDNRDGMTDCRLMFHPYDRTWECRFSWSSAYSVEASDFSLPLAICRAALLAVLPPATTNSV
jgi:hypothetical protein